MVFTRLNPRCHIAKPLRIHRLKKLNELYRWPNSRGNPIAYAKRRTDLARSTLTPQSVAMRSSAVGKRSQEAVRSGSCASLSVVVVSTGSATAQRAAQALREAARDLFAQLIVVAQSHEAKLAGSIERYGAEVVVAPSGCSRAEMCDLGMSRARGAIVAVRDDVRVGDAIWLDAYRRVLPRREVPAVAPFEAVVMDTLVASGAPLADRVALEAREARGDDSSIKIAAAV